MSVEMSWYQKQLTGATLELVEDGEKVKTFLLRRYPDKSAYSSWLVFTPFGIVISGDISVADHGVIAPGYGLEWFASRLDPDYLAEKFLREKWVKDRARASFAEWADSLDGEIEDLRKQIKKEWIEDNEGEIPTNDEIDFELPETYRKKTWKIGNQHVEGNQADAIRTLLGFDKLGYGVFDSPDRLYDNLPAYQTRDRDWVCPFDSDDISRGYGYEPSEIGWLSAIQKAFSELYPAIHK